MSGKSSFRERLAQLEHTEAKSQVRSGFPIGVALRLVGAVDRPVTLIQTLTGWGLGLRKAHDVVTRLTAGERSHVFLPSGPEADEVVDTLGRLGIEASFRRPPAIVDVREIRTKLGLTQREFAARFSLDLDSIQNWEQGRYLPDAPSRILLAVIDRHAEAVEDVLG